MRWKTFVSGNQIQTVSNRLVLSIRKNPKSNFHLFSIATPLFTRPLSSNQSSSLVSDVSRLRVAYQLLGLGFILNSPWIIYSTHVKEEVYRVRQEHPDDPFADSLSSEGTTAICETLTKTIEFSHLPQLPIFKLFHICLHKCQIIAQVILNVPLIVKELVQHGTKCREVSVVIVPGMYIMEHVD
ncbi:hypothetical protein P8452_48071 [Trifolium repens]|nr:hypothetical protein P8452_48071 [Trifolium repens]